MGTSLQKKIIAKKTNANEKQVRYEWEIGLRQGKIAETITKRKKPDPKGGMRNRKPKVLSEDSDRKNRLPGRINVQRRCMKKNSQKRNRSKNKKNPTYHQGNRGGPAKRKN